MSGTSVELLQKAADALLSDPKINIPLLDQVVEVMNHGSGEPQKMASKILTELKEQESSWTKVDGILEFSQLMETKYYALQILENLVQTRWKSLPREQCEGIKAFIVEVVIKTSNEEITDPQVKLYLHKLNLVLVQIVKQEWPKRWPDFVTEIVGSSRLNENLCLNNMFILKLLSEEIFDFDSDMTAAKANYLKNTFCSDFSAVFMLCHNVLESSENVPLLDATLHTLHRFLTWIPVGYIYETTLVNLLTDKFLGSSMFRCVTMQCLTEIGSLNVLQMAHNDGYVALAVSMFVNSIRQITQIVPPDANFHEGYKNGTDDEQHFIANLAQYLCSFLKENYQLVEVFNVKDADEAKANLKEAHSMALTYLLGISTVEDVEVFKICLDFWCWLCGDLYREFPFIFQHAILEDVLFGRESSPLPPRRAIYQETLSKLRTIIISRMAKPEEVLVVENDQGEVVREMVKDTDSVALYKTMRETLVFLTNLDRLDTERKMTDKMKSQMDGSEFSWKNLNSVCWAIGSISGAMLEEDEKRFLVTIIRDLLSLCEKMRGKDNKAVIASNIMYVVGQYPRFLRAHWRFLKTVTNKLFEFMHETHEGVQDMACDTFIKIAFKCRRQFVVIQPGEKEPFIDEILSELTSAICDLSPSQVHVFYEAVAMLISAQIEPRIREALIDTLMNLPNSIWDEIISHAGLDISVIRDPEVLRNIANILKTNVAVCKSVGASFISQLSKIYVDMLNVYKVTSENVSRAVGEQGEEILKQPLLKQMRAVKIQILTLISSWIANAENGNVFETALNDIVPPLFDAVLFDYQRNCPAAREPKVLSLLSIIVIQLKSKINSAVPRILDAVFTCTLEMINRDMAEFPEHRSNFFKLLNALNRHCFSVIVALPPELFRYFVDSVIWAFKHSMRDVAEIGLEILKDMLSQFAEYPEKAIAQNFYKMFFMDILIHVLSVVSDSNQIKIAGLTPFSGILCSLFYTAEFSITELLNPPQSNIDFIFEQINTSFTAAFPNLTQDQIRVTVKGFFSFNKDPQKMKSHLRDFLAQIKETVGEDTSDLFIEERELEIQNVQKAKNEVPGMLNPHMVHDDDAMG